MLILIIAVQYILKVILTPLFQGIWESDEIVDDYSIFSRIHINLSFFDQFVIIQMCCYKNNTCNSKNFSLILKVNDLERIG